MDGLCRDGRLPHKELGGQHVLLDRDEKDQPRLPERFDDRQRGAFEDPEEAGGEDGKVVLV